MFCPQFSCTPDHAVRVPRWPGARFDFFEFGRQQPELPGAIDDKILGHIGLATQMFDVKNQHIPHVDLLAAPGISAWPVGHCDICRQPGTKKSAEYPAEVDASAHVAIIADHSLGMRVNRIRRQALSNCRGLWPQKGTI
jgi:hypothetical protein